MCPCRNIHLEVQHCLVLCLLTDVNGGLLFVAGEHPDLYVSFRQVGYCFRHTLCIQWRRNYEKTWIWQQDGIWKRSKLCNTHGRSRSIGDGIMIPTKRRTDTLCQVNTHTMYEHCVIIHSQIIIQERNSIYINGDLDI